ncbi:MAG: phage holin family protein [Burkholderiaceae bacterium]|nr:phage holin family protein [Burkholderiaceae bacterium]
MFETLQKTRQLSLIALDRLGDYLALLRIELKLQGRELVVQMIGYAVAALLGLFVLLFLGIAIIVSFWDSDYRALAAWFVVLLYAGGAAAGVAVARKHSGKTAGLGTLRDELKRDVALVRESL